MPKIERGMCKVVKLGDKEVWFCRAPDGSKVVFRGPYKTISVTVSEEKVDRAPEDVKKELGLTPSAGGRG